MMQPRMAVNAGAARATRGSRLPQHHCTWNGSRMFAKRNNRRKPLRQVVRRPIAGPVVLSEGRWDRANLGSVRRSIGRHQERTDRGGDQRYVHRRCGAAARTRRRAESRATNSLEASSSRRGPHETSLIAVIQNRAVAPPVLRPERCTRGPDRGSTRQHPESQSVHKKSRPRPEKIRDQKD